MSTRCKCTYYTLAPCAFPTAFLGAWRAFLNAHALATKRINRDLAEAGLPDLTWYDVLWTLHRADGRRLRIRELADAVVLSSTGMTRFVDRLEAARPGPPRGRPGRPARGLRRDHQGGHRPAAQDVADLRAGIATYFGPAVQEGADLRTALDGMPRSSRSQSSGQS